MSGRARSGRLFAIAIEVADEHAISPRPRKSQRAPIFALRNGLRRIVFNVSGSLRLERYAHVQMVAQVLAHTRELVNDFDAGALQHVALSDTGELEQLRRLNRARGEEHFAPRPDGALLAALAIGEADRFASLEHNALRERAAFDGEIRALHRGKQIGVGSVAAAPAADVVLEVAHTLEARSVVIVRHGHARLCGRGDESFRQRIAILVARDVHRPFMPRNAGSPSS